MTPLGRIILAALLLPACVHQGPSVAKSCRHLAGLPQFRQCAEMVNIGAAIRADYRRERAAERYEAPPVRAAAPVFIVRDVAPMPRRQDDPPAQEPARVQTWMDTPYAPMVAPAYRHLPVTTTSPAIPPVAR